MTGNSMYHEELESEMASLHKKQAALIFTSGFVANEVSISTLARALPGSQGSLYCKFGKDCVSLIFAIFSV